MEHTHTHIHIPQLFAPPSSSTTVTDDYNTNVTMVYNDKLIDSIDLNKKMMAQQLQWRRG
jgi:hypothetical protein